MTRLEPTIAVKETCTPPADRCAVARAPWSFRLAKALMRHRVRGSYRLLDTTRRLGWLNRVVRYRLSDRISIDVPLFREDNCFTASDVNGYEVALMRTLDELVPTLEGPVTLVDGGADIGIFTLRLVARHANIARVVALEPNPDAFPWLCRNLERLPIEVRPIHAAVGEVAGRGHLSNPEDDLSDHAKFISPDNSGSVSIVSIDDVLARESMTDLLLKLDVEGAELPSLRGARDIIGRPRKAVVVFEAHPRVAARTGIDPAECLRLLLQIRPFEFRVAESPGIRLIPDCGVFQQLGQDRIFNIVAVSRGEADAA